MLKVKKCLLLRDNSFPELAFQGATIAILIDKIEVIWSFEHINILNDMFILFDIGQDVDLVHRTFFQLLVFFESPHLDHLHCVFLIVQLVYCTINLSVRSFANYLIQSVVLDYPNHHY